MSNRYESITFKDFSEGEGEKFFNAKNKKFYSSTRIKIDDNSKKIKLQNDLIDSTLPFNFNLINEGIISDGIKIYVMQNNAGTFKLYESADAITWTPTYTFAPTYSSGVERIGFYNNILFVYFDSGYYAKSIDKGSSWTFTYDPKWMGLAKSANMSSSIEGYFYFIRYGIDSPFLARTKDFVAIEDVYDFTNAVENVDQLFDFEGSLYCVIESTLYKFENNIPIKIRKFARYTTIQTINNESIIIAEPKNDHVRITIYDGANFYFTPNLTGYISADNLYEKNGFAYFILGTSTTNDIFRINSNGNIFKEYQDVTGSLWWGVPHKEMDIFLAYGINKVYRSNNYKLIGSIELPIIDDEMIPINLKIKHNPLPTGSTINVYTKKNLENTWSSVVISNTTIGSIKKEYRFENNSDVIDFFQIKIELITTNTTTTPEDITVELLYIPAGLKNAK